MGIGFMTNWILRLFGSGRGTYGTDFGRQQLNTLAAAVEEKIDAKIIKGEYTLNAENVITDISLNDVMVAELASAMAMVIEGLYDYDSFMAAVRRYKYGY